MSFEETKNGFTISSDKSKLDVNLIHDYLSNHPYWAEGIPFEVVKKSIENSVCFGVYEKDKLVGFARVITDAATFGYIADVFILESHRGKGLSKWLMECIIKHPEFQGFRRWVLLTRDAHGLYKKFGFTEPEIISVYMEIKNPDVYKI